MLTISNSIKKIALSLLVACLAIGFSASRDAQAKEKVKLSSFYYGLNQAGDEYTLISEDDNPENSCISAELDPCVLEYSTSQGPNFPNTILNPPPTGETASPTKGYVVP